MDNVSVKAKLTFPLCVDQVKIVHLHPLPMNAVLQSRFIKLASAVCLLYADKTCPFFFFFFFFFFITRCWDALQPGETFTYLLLQAGQHLFLGAVWQTSLTCFLVFYLVFEWDSCLDHLFVIC